MKWENKVLIHKTGDLVIVIIEEKDDKFLRKGNDLIYEQKLTLSEALTGYEFIITHLDGRNLIVKSNPNEIVKPNDKRIIEGEGMPFHKSPFEKGRLFLKFDVIFPTPEEIPLANRKKLESLFPPKPKLQKNVIADAEEVSAKEYQPMDYEQSGGGREQHSDDEDQQQGTRTECVHQ